MAIHVRGISRRTRKQYKKNTKNTKKQRGGNKFNPTNKQKQNMLKEAQNAALPHQKAVIFQTNSGYWTTRYVDKSESMLKADASAAESAAALASRKAKNTTAVSKQVKALQDDIEKGEKPGASAKDKLKAKLAREKLQKL